MTHITNPQIPFPAFYINSKAPVSVRFHAKRENLTDFCHSRLCLRDSKGDATLAYCPIRGNLVDLFFGFSNFQRLVNGCINADFCVQGVIFQRFSSFTFFPLCTSPEFSEFSNPLHQFLLKKTPKPKKRSTKLPRI